MTAHAIAMVIDLALILLAAGLASWAVRDAGKAVLKLRARRRADREWEGYIAAKPRGPELLAWLREQRAAIRRHGCVRPIPRDGDTELEEWEREEWERMKTFYADDGVNPYEQRRATGDLS